MDDMSAPSVPVSIKTIHVVKNKLNLLYPAIYGLPNQRVQHSMNSIITKKVNSLLHEQGYPHNPQTESTGYYEIKTNERGILSLSLFNYSFSGGAHGLTLQKSLTFDVQTGQSYTLQQLFKPGADYVARISAIVQAEIKKRDIPVITDVKTIRPDQDFYIADKALVIYFQVYELTAYYYGFVYFPISIYDIQDIIDENGPLGDMLS
jgi:hypothetical protein